MTDKSADEVRLCLTLLTGMSYGSKAIRDTVKVTTAERRKYWPPDLRALLEAIEQEDGMAVRKWFAQRALTLPDGKLPDAIVEYLTAHHQSRLSNELVMEMCKAAQLTPVAMLSGMKKLVAQLEEAGIKAADE